MRSRLGNYSRGDEVDELRLNGMRFGEDKNLYVQTYNA